MKLLFLVIIAFGLSASGQQPSTVETQSSGECSPNIISNQGRVQFTCNTAMDVVTAKKIVSLLNQVLQKTRGPNGPTDETNRKLDEILSFLENIQQQVRQRHLTEEQKEKFVSFLKASAPQELYFLSAPDAESTYFSSEISTALDAAGWKVVPHPPNWGTIERQGIGLFIFVPDVTKPVAPGASALQQAFKQIGVDAPADTFVMVPTDKFAIYVGVRPATTTH